MTAITARLRRLRLRLPAWRSLWRTITTVRPPALVIGAAATATTASLLYIAGVWLAGGLTFLTVFAGTIGPAGLAALFVLLLGEGRR